MAIVALNLKVLSVFLLPSFRHPYLPSLCSIFVGESGSIIAEEEKEILSIKRFLGSLYSVSKTANKTAFSSISYFLIQLAGTFWKTYGKLRNSWVIRLTFKNLEQRYVNIA